MKMRNAIKSGAAYEQLMAAVALLDFSDEPALGPACVSVYNEFGGAAKRACKIFGRRA